MREIYFIDANLLDSRTKEKSRQDFLHDAKHVSFAAESASLWNSSSIISPLSDENSEDSEEKQKIEIRKPGV